MNFFKSHFSYNKKQRNGVFYLLLIIVALQLVYFFVDFPSEEKNLISKNELLAFQNEVDSLQIIQEQNSKPKIFPFNPNYLTDFKAYQLGMSVEEIDKLLAYRDGGKYVNTAAQFQKVTGVNDSLLTVISVYFKFPDWKTKPLKKKTSVKSLTANDKTIIAKDINEATAEDLKIVRGIGDKLSERIVKYRIKLQGFSYDDQLYEVWNLDPEVVQDLLKYFKVFNPPLIIKINVNEASFKEVLSIVYIDYELTKKIFSYRDEVAEIQSLEELKKIDGFPIEKFDRIALYLVAE